MLVSKSEAARLAGVSRQTIHRKVSQGELSATDGMIDTSELIRVFGEIRDADSVTDDASQPVKRPSRGNSNVQVQLQARVDTLETQLAVTREQLRDTATDRDEWREMAKSANENVKLLTNQSGKGSGSNGNLVLVVIAAVIGVVLLVLGLTGNLGGAAPGSTEQPPTETMPTVVEQEPAELVGPPVQVPSTACSVYNINPFSKFSEECGLSQINIQLNERIKEQNEEGALPLVEIEELASRCFNDKLLGDEWIAAKCPEAMRSLAFIYEITLHENELSGQPTEQVDPYAEETDPYAW